MKPFNLEEYLANPNKELITRDGRKVKRILCTDVKSKYPVEEFHSPSSVDILDFLLHS